MLIYCLQVLHKTTRTCLKKRKLTPPSCQKFLKRTLCISSSCTLHDKKFRNEVFESTGDAVTRSHELNALFVRTILEDILVTILKDSERNYLSKCSQCSKPLLRYHKQHQNSLSCAIHSCLNCLKIFKNRTTFTNHLNCKPIQEKFDIFGRIAVFNQQSKQYFTIEKTTTGPKLIKNVPQNFPKLYYAHVKERASQILNSHCSLISLSGPKMSSKSTVLKYIHKTHFWSILFEKKTSDFMLYTTILRFLKLKVFLINKYINFNSKMVSVNKRNYTSEQKKDYISKLGQAFNEAGVDNFEILILFDFKLSNSYLLKIYQMLTFFNPYAVGTKKSIRFKIVFLENPRQNFKFEHFYLFLANPIQIIDCVMTDVEFCHFIEFESKELPRPIVKFITKSTRGPSFFKNLKLKWQYFRNYYEDYDLFKELEESVSTQISELFCETIDNGMFLNGLKNLTTDEILLIPIMTFNFCKDNYHYCAFLKDKRPLFNLKLCNNYLNKYTEMAGHANKNVVELIDAVNTILLNDNIRLEKIVTCMHYYGFLESYKKYFIFSMTNFKKMVKTASIFNPRHSVGLEKLLIIKKTIMLFTKLEKWSYYKRTGKRTSYGEIIYSDV